MKRGKNYQLSGSEARHTFNGDIECQRCQVIYRDVDNFLGLSKDAIWLKGVGGAGGGYAPSCMKCRSKNLLQNPRGVRE